MSTKGRQVVNNGQNFVNVVKEWPPTWQKKIRKLGDSCDIKMKDKIRQNHRILSGKVKKKLSSLFVKGHPSKGYKKLHIGAKAFLKSELIFYNLKIL